MKCSKSPADGAPEGQVPAQKRGNGISPSFASSWLTRDWVNVTVITLPKALRATKTLDPVSAVNTKSIEAYLKACCAALPNTAPAK